MSTYVIQIHLKVDGDTPADALNNAMNQVSMAESYKVLLNEDFEYPYIVENREGNCCVVLAHNAKDAKAKNMLRSEEGLRARLASKMEILHYQAMGGYVSPALAEWI